MPRYRGCVGTVFVLLEAETRERRLALQPTSIDAVLLLSGKRKHPEDIEKVILALGEVTL
jgi:hypothetical protein